jgi:peptidoglycan hydrolase-like protein with peptidoglycan-binding domain
MADPTLRLHDRAPDVARAQEFLNRAGAILDPDGDFGGGTVRAVREFRLANGLPDNGLIDSPMWDLLRALSEPSPDIPTKTVAFIAREEVGGRDYYDSSCARPAWPGGDSGVTIGVGYDLGYQTAFEDDCVARHDGWPASDSRMAGRCAPLGWSD